MSLVVRRLGIRLDDSGLCLLRGGAAHSSSHCVATTLYHTGGRKDQEGAGYQQMKGSHKS